MAQVSVVRYPDLPDEALEGLVAQVAESTALEVDVRIEPIGNGVPGYELVAFLLDEAARTAVDAVVAGAVAWAFDRIRKRRESDPESPGVRVVVWGPNYEKLSEVEVDDPEQSRDVTEGGAY